MMTPQEIDDAVRAMLIEAVKAARWLATSSGRTWRGADRYLVAELDFRCFEALELRPVTDAGLRARFEALRQAVRAAKGTKRKVVRP